MGVYLGVRGLSYRNELILLRTPKPTPFSKFELELRLSFARIACCITPVSESRTYQRSQTIRFCPVLFPIRTVPCLSESGYQAPHSHVDYFVVDTIRVSSIHRGDKKRASIVFLFDECMGANHEQVVAPNTPNIFSRRTVPICTVCGAPSVLVTY